MSEPKTLIDYQFTFKDGHQEFVSLVEGRDREHMPLTEAAWAFELNHEDGAKEEIVVYPAHLQCWRKAVREVKDEPTFEDAIKAE